jgi:hypothetical protein
MKSATLLYLTALGTIVCVAPAVSRPSVLNCQVTQFVGMTEEWRQIDRVEVDEARSSITFSIARTIGTDDDRSFTFKNEKDSISHDQVFFERFDDTIRIVALRLSTPVAIWVERSSVRLVALNKLGVEYVEFACR